MQLVVKVKAPTRPIQRPVIQVETTPIIGRRTINIVLESREQESNLRSLVNSQVDFHYPITTK